MTTVVMRCPSCGSANRYSVEVCEKCGQVLDHPRSCESSKTDSAFRSNRAIGAMHLEKRMEPGNKAPSLADMCYVSGLLSLRQGDLQSAILNLENALRSADRSISGSSDECSFKSMTNVMMSLAFQVGGKVHLAEQTSEDGLALARYSGDPSTIAMALVTTALLDCYLRMPERTLVLAAEAIELCQRHGFDTCLALARFYRAWALAEVGTFPDAFSKMQESIKYFDAKGGSFQGYEAAVFAFHCARVGRTRLALKILDDALAHATRTKTRLHCAEFLRIKGEVLLIQNTRLQKEAEGCFLAAIQLARSQTARWWELRAAASLARLARTPENREREHAALSEICRWFPEGINAPDLASAKALLQRLNDGQGP